MSPPSLLTIHQRHCLLVGWQHMPRRSVKNRSSPLTMPHCACQSVFRTRHCAPEIAENLSVHQNCPVEWCVVSMLKSPHELLTQISSIAHVCQVSHGEKYRCVVRAAGEIQWTHFRRIGVSYIPFFRIHTVPGMWKCTYEEYAQNTMCCVHLPESHLSTSEFVRLDAAPLQDSNGDAYWGEYQ